MVVGDSVVQVSSSGEVAVIKCTENLEKKARRIGFLWQLLLASARSSFYFLSLFLFYFFFVSQIFLLLPLLLYLDLRWVHSHISTMIRGNYSLAKEVRKNELKQRQKIQQRQKHQHQLEKLRLLDPIRLYFQIQKLQASQEDPARLKRLQEDWKFIEKNKLHEKKLKPFLEEQKRKQEDKRKAEAKLWGKRSVYFNPELNPLGKVPDSLKLAESPEGSIPNITLPLKLKTSYSPDPLIETWGVVLPEGPRPQFYKNVVNLDVKKEIVSKEEPKKIKRKEENENFRKPGPDSDSDVDLHSEEEYDTKRARYV